MNTYTPTPEQIIELDNSVESYFRNLLEIPIVETFYNSKNKNTIKTSFIKLAVINDNDPIPECVKNIYYDCKYYDLSHKRFIFYYDNNETNNKPVEYFDLLEQVHTMAYNLSGINKHAQYPRADYALCTADYKNNKFVINHTPTLTILFIGLCILLLYCSTTVGELNNFTCFIRPILIYVGFTITTGQIIIHLITHFTQRNRYTIFINKYKYIFFSGLFFLDLSFIIIYYFSPSTPKYLVEQYDKENLDFRRCEFSTFTSQFIIISITAYKELMLSFGLFIIYKEWRIKTSTIILKRTIKVIIITKKR